MRVEVDVSNYSVTPRGGTDRNIDPEQTVFPGLADLSRKTGLIVRAFRYS